jgi:hypothetical protein
VTHSARRLDRLPDRDSIRISVIVGLAHARTVEIDSSHASYVWHPAAVAALIRRSARAAG